MKFVFPLVAMLACTSPADINIVTLCGDPDAAIDSPFVQPDAPPPDATPCNPNPPTVFVDPAGQHTNVTIQKPGSYNATCDTPRKLVIFFGSYGSSTGYSQQIDLGFKFLKDLGPDGVLVMAPDGLLKPGTTTSHYWNADPSCCDTGHVGNDDTAYVRALVTWVLTNYNVDPRYVVAVGQSNGGFMTERARCDIGDLFTHVVDKAGQGVTTSCTTINPVHALVDHSLADTGISYNGGHFTQMPVNYINTLSTLAQHEADNDCTGLHVDTVAAFDHDANVTGNDTDRLTYTSCTGAVTEHWREMSSTHNFTLTNDITTLPPLDKRWAVDVWNWIVANPG